MKSHAPFILFCIVMFFFINSMIILMFRDSNSTTPNVETVAMDYKTIGHIDRWKVQRTTDTEHNVACYVLDGSRGLSCVQLRDK